jgi:hypothetical protein
VYVVVVYIEKIEVCDNSLFQKKIKKNIYSKGYGYMTPKVVVISSLIDSSFTMSIIAILGKFITIILYRYKTVNIKKE